MSARPGLAALALAAMAVAGCAALDMQDEDRATPLLRGAERTGLGPELPADVEPTCVSQMLYESGLEEETIEQIRALGADPATDRPFNVSADDAELIRSALDHAAAQCRPT